MVLPPVSREHAGLRADAYLSLQFPSLPRHRIRQKIQMGESLLNGGRYASSARLAEGDIISVEWRNGAPGMGGPAVGVPALPPILFEDDWMIAVDKPAGMASHPMGRRQEGTLIQLVRGRCQMQTAEHLSHGDMGFYPSLVNRLDMFTSGVVIVAKTRAALVALQRLAAEGRIEKRYLALVEGIIERDEGRIELALAPDTTSGIRVKMRACPEGLASVTEYRVIQRLAANTLVYAFPRTGRQHQIRVHFAAIGHPVWGDLLYKDQSLFLRYSAGGCVPDESLPSRHCLHAGQVRFTHPATGTIVSIEAPVPEDFSRIVRSVS